MSTPGTIPAQYNYSQNNGSQHLYIGREKEDTTYYGEHFYYATTPVCYLPPSWMFETIIFMGLFAALIVINGANNILLGLVISVVSTGGAVAYYSWGFKRWSKYLKNRIDIFTWNDADNKIPAKFLQEIGSPTNSTEFVNILNNHLKHMDKNTSVEFVNDIHTAYEKYFAYRGSDNYDTTYGVAAEKLRNHHAGKW